MLSFLNNKPKENIAATNSLAVEPKKIYDTTKKSKDDVSIMIKLINSNVSLMSIINYYEVNLIRNKEGVGWTHVANCPFPFHNDSSPSFHYNSKEDRFNCFGCSKSGKAVEFVAHMESVSFTKAAEMIEKDFGININKDSIQLEFADYSDKNKKIIFDFCQYCQEFVSKNRRSKEKLDIFNNILYTVDMFLLDALNSNGSIDNEKLEYRITRAKELLQEL